MGERGGVEGLPADPALGETPSGCRSAARAAANAAEGTGSPPKLEDEGFLPPTGGQIGRFKYRASVNNGLLFDSCLLW